MAQEQASLEVLQAHVEVLAVVVQELCRAMPARSAGAALEEVRRQVNKLAQSAGEDETEDADAQRAAVTARVLSALGSAASSR